jgi:hypothetical protein
MTHFQTVIDLNEAEQHQLEAEASARQLPLPDLVRAIILEHLQASKPVSRTDYLSIVGLGHSGLHNVAEQHDQYLGQAIADEHLR